MRLIAHLFACFRRRRTERLSGVVRFYSTNRGIGWIAPHENLPELTFSAKTLPRAGLRDLNPGDRVTFVRDGSEARRLRRYRESPQWAGV